MANTFEKAFARELGKNTAKLASNALFGSHWSTPYRRVDPSRQAYNEARAQAANARAEAERAKAQAAIDEANARIQLAREEHLNRLDAAVIKNVDKLTMAPIPSTVEGIVHLMSTLSVQMKSIKFKKGSDDSDDSDESEIRNKYLYALIERYRQCIFELQCLNPNDPHIPIYGQILVDKEYEIKKIVSTKKIKTLSSFLFLAAISLASWYYLLIMENVDGSWFNPKYILFLLAAILCVIAVPTILIITSRKRAKNKKIDLNSYGVITDKPKPIEKENVEKQKAAEFVKVNNEIEEPIIETAEEGISIFFDLNENNRIGTALGQIWEKYRGIAPAALIERKPIFAADGVEDCILFVGVNPSYDPSDDDYFLKNDDGKSLLYGSFYQREDAPDYFKNLEDFAAQAGKSYVQMNLLYARENDRNKLMKADPNFIREQLELTYDTIVKLQPKAILFFTTYCKNLIFGADRWVNPDVIKKGAYILNGTNIPVFFCEDVTTLTPTNRAGMIEIVKRAL